MNSRRAWSFLWKDEGEEQKPPTILWGTDSDAVSVCHDLQSL